LALLLGGVFVIKTGSVSVEAVLFYTFSGIAVVFGSLLVTQPNPARAAMCFALVVLSTCGLFLIEAAPFLMAATTIIYAGAIIVTFLFVLMLAQQERRSDADWRSREPLLASVAGFVLLGALLAVLQLTYDHPKTNAALAQLDSELDRAAAALQKPTPEAVLHDLDWNKFFEKSLEITRQLQYEPNGPALEKKIRNKDEDWTFNMKLQPAAEKVAFLKYAVNDIQSEVLQARRTLGDLQLRADERGPVSTFSGSPPRPSVKHDEHGNAPLPAENTASLGRALFTDYLLAVELGGTLLLVATIGAIAIAGRREEPRP
jgi:NADH:ubiquinone oxidoreductase subunit 6 (subunit J)